MTGGRTSGDPDAGRARPTDDRPSPDPGRVWGVAGRLAVALAGIALLLLVPAWVAPHLFGSDAMQIERDVLAWFHGLSVPGLDRSLREASNLSEGIVLSTMATMGALLVWRRDRWTALLLPVSYLGPLALHYTGKLTIGRPRPEFIEWSEHLASASSYPSGHAMGGAAFYLVLGWVVTRREPGAGGVVIWTLVALLILASGVNRLYLGVHWPSDVLASWIAGLLWGAVCISARKRLESGGPSDAEKPARGSSEDRVRPARGR